MGSSITYFWGHRMEFLNFDIFMSLKIVFIQANSADSGEMAFCSISSGSTLFVKVSILGFPVKKSDKKYL